MNSTVSLSSPPSARRASKIATAVGLTTVLAVAAVAVGRFVHEPSRAPTATGPGPSRSVAVGTSLQGLEALEARVAADPTDVEAWRAVATTTLSEGVRTGDPAYYLRSRQALDNAERLVPGASETAVVRAVLDLSVHDFDAAYEIASGLRVTAPTPAALAALVDASVETGRYDEAASVLQELLDRRPDVAALTRVSYLRELNGDDSGAIAAMRQAQVAAGSTQDRATVSAFLGDLLAANDDIAGAQSAYSTALTLQPGHVGAGLGIARLQARQGDLAGAMQTAGDVARSTPLPAATVALAELQRLAGNTIGATQSEALADASFRLLRASAVSVDLEAALFDIDRGTLENGQIERGLAQARAAYGSRRTIFTADALGWALTKSGRAVDALAYVAEATRLSTTAPSVHIHAALAHEAAGDIVSARRELAATFTRSPVTALALQPEALSAAGRLGVEVPTAWMLA
jgi:tetratricopeptide (TPR) repeat protein